jgi:hypothetical protein
MEFVSVVIAVAETKRRDLIGSFPHPLEGLILGHNILFIFSPVVMQQF